ncbi:MAG: copper oxidase [Thermodesulfobacteriota bacterium]
MTVTGRIGKAALLILVVWALAVPGTRLPSWAAAPGRPGRDYAPVVVPNGTTLPWHLVEGVKVFHLVAAEFEHEFAPGLIARVWGYNGQTPGPVIEAVAGDRVRIYVTNRLPEGTSVHWHGMIVPNGMDGVAGLTQREIRPGETFRYEFTLRTAGTFMYHPHRDEMIQMGMGLTGMFVVHPRLGKEERADRDFALMLHEWLIEPGTRRPHPGAMSGFNVLTINGKAFPATDALVASQGERVRIRLGNLSAMEHHPIHLHGYSFKITATDGGPIPAPAQWPETTVLVPVGTTRDIELVASHAGDWLMHCHMTHHVMNQMGHGPSLLGLDPAGLDQRVGDLVSGSMIIGQTGMAGMAEMGMPVPRNSIPMAGKEGPWGFIDMGGMVTVLKVRPGLASYEDPGWYRQPAGTTARPATAEELAADGIR